MRGRSTYGVHLSSLSCADWSASLTLFTLPTWKTAHHLALESLSHLLMESHHDEHWTSARRPTMALPPMRVGSRVRDRRNQPVLEHQVRGLDLRAMRACRASGDRSPEHRGARRTRVARIWQAARTGDAPADAVATVKYTIKQDTPSWWFQIESTSLGFSFDPVTCARCRRLASTLSSRIAQQPSSPCCRPGRAVG